MARRCGCRQYRARGQPRIAALGEQRHDWGQYYAQRPQVFAGSIQLGYRQLCERGIPQRLGLRSSCVEAPHAA